jgi:hypothetical protein
MIPLASSQPLILRMLFRPPSFSPGTVRSVAYNYTPDFQAEKQPNEGNGQDPGRGEKALLLYTSSSEQWGHR